MIGFALLILTGVGVARGQEAPLVDHVHLTTEGGASPFEAALYSVRDLGSGALLVQTKMFPYSGALENRVVLVERQEVSALCAVVTGQVERLRESGYVVVGDSGGGQQAQEERKEGGPSKLPFTVVWRLQYQCGGESGDILLAGETTLPGEPGWAVVGAVTGLVEANLGEIRFRDLVVSQNDLGWVYIRTIPSVEVEIDGIPTGLKSPILEYRLRAGPHNIRLISRDHGIDKRRRIEVRPGQYTNFYIDFTDPLITPESPPVE